MEVYYIELIDDEKLVKIEQIQTQNYDDVLAKVANYMKMPYRIKIYNKESYQFEKNHK